MTRDMRTLSLTVALISASVGFTADRRDFIPPDARMVVCINVGAVSSSPVSKQDSNIVQPLAESLNQTAKYLGLGDTRAIEHIWITVGENYPKGTLIVAQGKFDPDRLRRQFQEL